MFVSDELNNAFILSIRDLIGAYIELSGIRMIHFHRVGEDSIHVQDNLGVINDAVLTTDHQVRGREFSGFRVAGIDNVVEKRVVAYANAIEFFTDVQVPEIKALGAQFDFDRLGAVPFVSEALRGSLVPYHRVSVAKFFVNGQ
jgi:hypothetical protein